MGASRTVVRSWDAPVEPPLSAAPVAPCLARRGTTGHNSYDVAHAVTHISHLSTVIQRFHLTSPGAGLGPRTTVGARKLFALLGHARQVRDSDGFLRDVIHGRVAPS